MSVSPGQQSFSSSSTVGGWLRTATGPQRRAPSVYGAAGGFGTRISSSSSSSSSSVFSSSGFLTTGSELTVVNGGKITMQNLNERLASYLEKVRSLEDRNGELQLNIVEFCEKTKYVPNDYTSYFSTIAGLKAEIQCLKQSVSEVKGQYSVQLSRYQSTITALETELQDMKLSLEQLPIKYTLLLELKARLENEIAEYRRLLEGEAYEQKKAVIIKQVTEEVEEQKPHIEKRVRTIVEQIVDGIVVSSSVDTQVHTVQ